MMKDQKRNINVCTWNLCLGLQYKIDYVREILFNEKIDVLCLQETELEGGLGLENLKINGYELEADYADTIRSVVYVSSALVYERLKNTGRDKNLIVLKIIHQKHPSLYISAIYRPWKDENGLTQGQAFADQVLEMKRLIPAREECIVLGDFNINYEKRNNRNVVNRGLTQTLNTMVDVLSLEQMVNFPTWSRAVNGSFRSSILDHVYVNEQQKVKSVTSISVPISDHLPVKIEYEFQKKSTRNTVMVRNWKGYSKEKWINELSKVDWNITQETVQDIANHIEEKLMNTLQIIAPVEEQLMKNNSYLMPPHLIKLRRQRKNLFKNAQRRKSVQDLKRCREMDKQIRKMDYLNQRNKIRQKLKKGDSATLWEAVNIAKGASSNNIPDVIITRAGDRFKNEGRPQAFADFFQEKVEKIRNETLIPDNPDLGRKKITVNCEAFFTYEKILKTMQSLKSKKCYGYDNIPLLVLKDGAQILAEPFTSLFKMIYQSGIIPDQWKISRTIPLYKKGNKNDMNSYRPISNLCSASKIFERMMLNRLTDIEDKNAIDLTGLAQHGFKKGRSTVTALKQIQSQIARSIDQGDYVAMGSLDLSAAFDVVNVELLMKRLTTLGLPTDWLHLLESWLTDRAAFVEVSPDRSMLYNIDIGTVQGSILGPVLFSLFVYPILENGKLVAYADDSYAIVASKTKEQVTTEIGTVLTEMTIWFKNSGLKVNETKTEIAVFFKTNTCSEEVIVNAQMIKTKNVIKVLGVMMDTTLSWHKHVTAAVSKMQSKIHAIHVIQRYFLKDEILQLLKMYCYPSLYYASSVWLTPSLAANLRSKLFSTSGRILSVIELNSFRSLHKKYSRAPPEMWQDYELAVSLFDLNTTRQPVSDWQLLQGNTLGNKRSSKLHFTSTNNLRCGLNLLPNRLKQYQIELRKNGLR